MVIGNHYISTNINERSLILLKPLSAVTKVKPPSIAVAAIKASGTANFISLFSSIVFFLIEVVMGITWQYSTIVSLISISFFFISFTPRISISVTIDIVGGCQNKA